MSARQENIGVQYLRGLAAVAVVLCHVKGTAGQDKYFGTGLLGNFLDAGQIGADLFFVISGFIITLVSLDARGEAPGISRRDFFARRFARIVPLMWVAILSYTAMRIAGRGLADWPEYVNALFLLPHGELLPQTIWTLRQELLFYLIFAVAMLGPVRRPWLIALWVGLALAFWVGMQVALAQGWVTPAQLTTPGARTLRVLLHTSALEFGAGMVIALVWMRRGQPGGLRLPVDSFWVLTLLVAVAMAVFAGVIGTPLLVLQLPLLIALLAFTVWLGVRAECPPGPVRDIGLLLGNASYAIYLFHPHVISPMAALWSKIAPGTPMGLVVAVVSTASVLAGIAAHLLIEKPLVRAARRWLASGGAPRPH